MISQQVIDEFCVEVVNNRRKGYGDSDDMKKRAEAYARNLIEFLGEKGYEIDNKFVDHNAWVIIERKPEEHKEDGIRWKAFPCIQKTPEPTVDIVVDKGQRYILAKGISLQTKG